MVTFFLSLFLYFTAPPVSVEVLPKLAMAPNTIRVTVRAEPHESNRGLAVIVDSPDYYRASFDPDFAGEDSPKIRNYHYELRYPGVYTVTVILQRAKPNRDEVATTQVCLKGQDVEC